MVSDNECSARAVRVSSRVRELASRFSSSNAVAKFVRESRTTEPDRDSPSHADTHSEGNEVSSTEHKNDKSPNNAPMPLIKAKSSSSLVERSRSYVERRKKQGKEVFPRRSQSLSSNRGTKAPSPTCISDFSFDDVFEDSFDFPVEQLHHPLSRSTDYDSIFAENLASSFLMMPDPTCLETSPRGLSQSKDHKASSRQHGAVRQSYRRDTNKSHGSDNDSIFSDPTWLQTNVSREISGEDLSQFDIDESFACSKWRCPDSLPEQSNELLKHMDSISHRLTGLVQWKDKANSACSTQSDSKCTTDYTWPQWYNVKFMSSPIGRRTSYQGSNGMPLRKSNRRSSLQSLDGRPSVSFPVFPPEPPTISSPTTDSSTPRRSDFRNLFCGFNE